MNSRAQQLFEELCELTPAERTKRLAEHNLPPEALAEVQSLLAAHDNCGDFLGDATSDFQHSEVDEVAVAEGPGDTIGRYKLLEKIGEGGFGLVYMAQQTEPVRRKVALKIIKVGMDTKQTVARFEAERQALAIMDHPNIAKVLDGGATASGRPYFVMELVRGEPITGYGDQCRMSLPERLRLFRQVCLAIEHAHQKGVVHRDIKPSNVLVTIADGRPLVKVIDFGIAKALNVELTDRTLYTEFKQLIGTPLYMSPEQAERSGVDIDTRSDVYSLGVLLYEMLTGTTPVDPQALRRAAWGQWQKMIVEDEPTKPSTLMSSGRVTPEDIARARSTDAIQLSRVLRGDLDWIVLKALEKDRSRRYSTASQLAEDIDRYLLDEPVLATPPSKIYALRKLIRRNRRTALSACLLLAVVLIGLFTTSVTAVWANRQRRIAQMAMEQSQERANQVRSLSALAGTPILEHRQAETLSQEWSRMLDQMAASTDGDDPELLRFECQYATWLTTHAIRFGDRKDRQAAVTRAKSLIPRAKRVLPQNDSNLLSLLNAAIQLRTQMRAPSQELAPMYGELLPYLTTIRGETAAIDVIPEYLVHLAAAGDHDKMPPLIDRYLMLVKDHTITHQQFARLNAAVDKLASWGQTHSELYDRLRFYRDAGRPKSEAAEGDSSELEADLKLMQGHWTMMSRGRKVNMHVQGNRADVEFVNNENVVVQRGSAQISLSRSGACKLLTRYHVGQTAEQGDAVIYQFHQERLILAEGMLTGKQNDSDPQMRIWTRPKQ